MASQALYRKWRSQTFDELVGQEHVLQTLRNAIQEDRIAHAYLFTGPRGVGKTSMARLLAKAVNCAAPPDQRPCGECESCKAVAQGRMVDVIEMDAASHTSVDDARELIERVQFRPTMGRAKVYIIDEVHMLSTAAFNALLKTLEEPPEHALFVMATTEVHKVPATILSRCQRFTFARITNAAIAEHIRHIAEQETLVLEAGVAEAIARAATGSMRDAIGVLEQVRSFSRGTIMLEQVHSLLGMSSSTEIASLIDALLDDNLSQVFRTINNVADQGTDMRQFTRDLIDHLRSLMVLMATKDRSLIEGGEDEARLFEEWMSRADIAAVMHWIKLFSNLDYQLRTSPYGHLPLELAAVEALVVPAQEMAPPAPVRGTSHKPTKATPPPPKRPTAPPPAAPPPAVPSEPPAPSAKTPPAVPDHSPPTPSVPNESSPIDQPATAQVAENPSTSYNATSLSNDALQEEHYQDDDESEEDTSLLSQVEDIWQNVVHDVRPYDSALQAVLRGVQPVDVEDSTVVLLATSKFHKENIEKPRRRQIVEEVLSKHMGAAFSIRCTFDAPMKKKDFRRQIQTVRKDPLVRAAINIFRADIIDISEEETF
jgi:DNA polymerase-3 subunit gamma/tau